MLKITMFQGHKLWVLRIEFSLSKIHVEALMPIVTVSGDEAFKEMISVSWGHKGQALLQ